MHRFKAKQFPIGLGLVILVITAIGAALRLFFVLRTDFPLNDGGMFLLMTSELVQNHFYLPEFTAYNFSQIPYAYPPLPFYIAGITQQLTHLDLSQIFLYLPTLISVLTIPAFFLLSRAILEQDYPAIHATLIFAILPTGYEWLIMGGGVARSPAFLFSVLSIWLSIRALKSHSRWVLAWSAFFLGLTAISHLEIFLISSAWIAISAFFLSKDRWGIAVLLGIGCGTAVISAPWWITVLMRHSIQPYLNAFGTGGFNLLIGLADLLLRNLSNEFLFTPILVLGILGLARQILKRDWLLPSWVIVVALLGTRSLERNLSIPVSILAGIAISEVLLPGLSMVFDPLTSRRRLFPNLLSAILISYILLRSALMALLYINSMTQTLNAVSPLDRAAMRWISNHTSSSSQFLVLTTPQIWENNGIAEWFPVLSERMNISTVQGTEWLPAGTHVKRIEFYNALQGCVIKTDFTCLDEASIHSDQDYSHIYLSGKMEDRISSSPFPLPIETALRESPDYSLIYENEQALIFEHKP